MIEFEKDKDLIDLEIRNVKKAIYNINEECNLDVVDIY